MSMSGGPQDAQRLNNISNMNKSGSQFSRQFSPPLDQTGTNINTQGGNS